MISAFAVLTVIAALGAVLTGKLVDYAEREYRQGLLRYAELAAGNFDPTLLAEMAATGVSSQQQCSLVWNRLEQIKQLVPELRYVYLMYLDGSDIRFLGDSSSPSCSDFSTPDGVYQEASTALRQLFADGRPFVEGPLADRWGEWVSALAPILAPDSGRVLAVLGMDVDSGDYRRVIAVYKWAAIAVSLLVGGLIILFGCIQQRTKDRRDRLDRLNHELRKEIVAREQTEKKKEEQLMFLQVLIDAIPAPVIYKDAAGRYLGCNRRFEEAVLISRDEIVGRTMEELFAATLPPEQFRLLQEKSRELKELGPNGSLDYETLLTRVDNYSYHVVAYMANFPDADGELGGSVAIFLNVTEQKEMEKALQESETRFRSIFSNAAAGVIVVDAHGKFVQANPAYCQLVGYSELELLQMDYAGVTHPDDLDDSKRLYRNLLRRRNERFEIEKRLQRKNGEIVWAKLNGSWIYGADRMPLYAVILVIDITENKRAHDELQAQKDLLDNIINHVPASIFWKDRDLIYLGCNKVLARQAGYADPSEMIGKTDYDMAWKKEEADFFRECDRKVMESGEAMLNIEEPQLQADGKEATLLTSKVPLTDRDGNVIGLLGVFTDISERKRLQEQSAADLQREKVELLQLKAEVEEAFRRKNEFIAKMSHEIRTPMNSIIGMTELALEGALEREQRECLEMVQQAAKSLLTLLNDLLDYSRFETGNLELEQIDFDLDLLLQSVLTTMRQGAQIKGLALRTALDPQLKQVFRGDPVRLKHILTCLLTNAIKYTEHGSIDFKAVRLDHGDDEKQGCIQFSVSDTGAGIPAEKLSYLFDCFAAGDASGWRHLSNGNGFGLPICKQLVDLMGGEIQVESAVDQGSCFRVRLPLPLSKKVASVTGNGKSRSLSRRNVGLRVLLAEDNLVNQKLARRLLEKIGCMVTLAENGRQAIERLRQEAFDLILMDIQMPLLDGLEATGRIRAGEAGEAKKSLPIIALTAHAMDGDRERFLAAGMDAYLSKPLDSAALYATIDRLLPTAGGRRRAHDFQLPVTDVLDYESALERMDHDRELLEESFKAFLASAPEQGMRLRNAIQEHDFQLVSREAHSMKGAAALIGAKCLRETALHLEIAAGERNLDKCLLLVPKFEKELSVVLDLLRFDQTKRVG